MMKHLRNCQRFLSDLDKDEKEIILGGDTNCDFKDSKNTNAKKLRLVYSEYHSEQMIKDHTRFAPLSGVCDSEINAWRLKKKERKFVESRSMKKYDKRFSEWICNR